MASRPVATIASGIDAAGPRRRQQVAGDLEPDEIRIGHVAIEGLDDPVAVAPGFAEVALRGQLDQVAGIGVADDVEPVPAPPLAIGRRGQQPVHHPREGVGRRVGQERLDLLGGRRQARSGRRSPGG